MVNFYVDHQLIKSWGILLSSISNSGVDKNLTRYN